MNKLILLSALTLFSCSAFIPATSQAQASAKAKSATPDGTVMMKGGKMMMMQGGKWVPMAKDMAMTNGTKVMMNGTTMTKDGKKMMMKDGDMMGPDGMMAKKM